MAQKNKDAQLDTLETEGMKFCSYISKEMISHLPLPWLHPSTSECVPTNGGSAKKKGTVTGPCTPLHTKTTRCLCDPSMLTSMQMKGGSTKKGLQAWLFEYSKMLCIWNQPFTVTDCRVLLKSKYWASKNGSSDASGWQPPSSEENKFSFLFKISCVFEAKAFRQ